MTVNVSLIQHQPDLFDKKSIFQGINKLVESESAKGSDLIIFPESYIPGYPRGFDFGAVIGSRSKDGREQYRIYFDNSVDLASEDGEQLEKIASDHNVYLVIGITERESTSGTLYCSVVYISPEKGILGVHRKIKPTASERVVWGEGDGSGLVTFNTPLGILGGLICWENYMPEARLSMYRKGVQIYIAPTADARENWITTMKHIALEGRCFVLSCNQFVQKKDIPAEYLDLLKDQPEVLCKGGSVIISPMGEVIEGPLWNEAGIVRAEIDLSDITRSKMDFDVNGHYSRPDIFSFEVKDQPDTF